MDQNPELTELWLNQNQIENPEDVEYLSRLTKLKTIYLADNALVKQIPNYLDTLKSIVPSLEQIDGNLLRQGFNFKIGQTNVKSITKKEIDPKAKELLEDVISKNQ